jgi:hypothetical protein
VAAFYLSFKINSLKAAAASSQLTVRPIGYSV